MYEGLIPTSFLYHISSIDWSLNYFLYLVSKLTLSFLAYSPHTPTSTTLVVIRPSIYDETPFGFKNLWWILSIITFLIGAALVVAGIFDGGALGLSFVLFDDKVVEFRLLSMLPFGTKTLILLLGYGFKIFKLKEFGELKSSFLTKKKLGLLLFRTLWSAHLLFEYLASPCKWSSISPSIF